MNRFLIFVFLFTSLPVSAYAQNADPGKLETLTDQQKQAEKQAQQLAAQQEKIRGEIDGLQDDLVATSSKAREFELAGTKARKYLAELSRQEAILKAKILSDRTALSDMLAALQRIDKSPPPALLVHPNSAVDAARAAHLLASLSLSLNENAADLQKKLADLQTLRNEITKSRIEIGQSAKAVDTRLGTIKSIIKTKTKLNSQLDKDRQKKTAKATRLARQAKDLRDLIARFEDSAETILPRIKPSRTSRDPLPRLKPKPGKAPAPAYLPTGSIRFADARGQIPLPVFGTLSRNYGAKLAGGSVAKGISLKTGRKAQVIAPFSGRIEFSGQFNDDHVIILNVGGGYFIVLTGLGDTFTTAGTSVKAGEPLGLMPTSGPKSPELFMEFRKNRASINPKPWIGPALARSKG
ncbi:MAG: peptidoglycan DD-metalloendopeptidase family protein [Robiginitomaculum sp.]|nr:peptidoglycan DD-metalloendopeptidase family protein [Robiginitomaculum sp.]